jgi:hypothetical protein
MNQSKPNDPSKPNYKSALYLAYEPQWTIVSDVVDGALKLRECADTYLPQFPKEPDEAYQIRVKASVLFTATEVTLGGLVGLVFQRSPELGEDVPDPIKEVLENADLKGNHWRVFAKDAFSQSIELGKGFILVDMPPPLAEGASMADEKAANRRPYFVFYRRDQALNWRTVIVNGKEKLQQITFEEFTFEADGEFGDALVKRYRTFALENGMVKWTLRRLLDEGKDAESFVIEDTNIIKGFNEIPVAQILDFDKPPLLDLALMNVRHFRQLSDYDVSLHIGNMELLWARGLEDDGIMPIGHHFLFKLADEGEMGFASPTGACIEAARTNLEDAKKDMALMGLSFVAEQARVEKTATQSNIDNGQETSKLATMAQGLKDGLEKCLNFVARYLSIQAQNKMTVELTATENLMLSPEDERILSDQVFRGQLSLETMWSIKKLAGKLPQDFDPDKEREKISSPTDV